MENDIAYKDKSIATGFIEDEYSEELTLAIPTLNNNNLRFIGKFYKKLGKCPTYGELRLFGRILEKRRPYAEGALISALGTDSIALIETYNDLKAKSKVIFGDKVTGLTLDETASVAGRYLRMIGRYDSRSFAKVPEAKPDRTALTLRSDDGKALLTFGAPKTRKKAEAQKLTEKFSVILLDGDNYDTACRSLFADKRLRAACKGRIRVGEYGIVGTLSEVCGGAKAALDRLSADTPIADLLADSYIGKYILFTEPKYTKTVQSLAGINGLSAIHFANTDNSGQLKTRYADIPLALVKALKNSRRAIAVCVSDSDPTVACKALPLTADKNGKVLDVSDEKLIKSKERLVAAVRVNPAENSFGAAVNAVTDSALRLVAAGVDRRAICSAAAYGFPSRDTEAESLGESLALVLGAYRVGIELAFSEGVTITNYGEERSLSSALYASAPRHPMSATAVGNGSNIGFLPIATGSDGLVDFNSLRRVCDSFRELTLKGKILSARAVTTTPADEIKEMTKGATVHLSESGKIIADTPCRGILFETDSERLEGLIGKIEAAPAEPPEESIEKEETATSETDKPTEETDC